MTFSEKDFSLFLKALNFAAEKHRLQKRKDASRTPYFNHPLQVATVLYEVGGVRDIQILIAALLHDTLEDTDATAEELAEQFGDKVAGWVKEMSDNKSLPYQERKRLQVEHAGHISREAALVKIADKSCNVADIGNNPPFDWPDERCTAYLEWAEKVVKRIATDNQQLKEYFYTTLEESSKKLIEHMKK